MSKFGVDEFIVNLKSNNVGRVVARPHAPGYVPVIIRYKNGNQQIIWWNESNCDLAENINWEKTDAT